MPENDMGSIEAYGGIGNFEGNVSAEAPGGVDMATLESGVNNGMSGALDASAPITMDTLGLGLPTFESSPLDVAMFAGTVASSVAAVMLVLGGSPSASVFAAISGFALNANLPGLAAVLRDSAVSAQFSMGNPGVFIDSNWNYSSGGVGGSEGGGPN